MLAAAAFALIVLAAPVTAASTPVQIASDPFTQATCAANALTNHQANVEPDSKRGSSSEFVSRFERCVRSANLECRDRHLGRPPRCDAILPPGPSAR